MAEAAAVADEATETRGKKSRLLLVGGVVVLLGALAAAWFLVLAPGGDDPEAVAAAEAEAAAAAAEEGEIIEVTNVTASLEGPDPHFAKIGFSAVLSATAVAEEVTPRFPLLTDAALAVLAGTQAETLRSPAGSEQLRTDLTAAAQEIWPDGAVLRIVLTELVVQ